MNGISNGRVGGSSSLSSASTPKSTSPTQKKKMTIKAFKGPLHRLLPLSCTASLAAVLTTFLSLPVPQ